MDEMADFEDHALRTLAVFLRPIARVRERMLTRTGRCFR